MSENLQNFLCCAKKLAAEIMQNFLKVEDQHGIGWVIYVLEILSGWGLDRLSHRMLLIALGAQDGPGPTRLVKSQETICFQLEQHGKKERIHYSISAIVITSFRLAAPSLAAGDS
jgi:hypothetical protein